MFGRRVENKEGQGAPEDAIPDSLITAVAEQFFRRYGEQLANFINMRVAKSLEPIKNTLAKQNEEIARLKAASSENFKEMVRSILEVQIETIADKAAENTIEKAGMQTELKSLQELASKIKELEAEIVERVEKIEELQKSNENAIESHQKTLASIMGELHELQGSMSKTIEDFRMEVSKAVAHATKEVREAMTVDRSKIESVLGDIVRRVVDSKMAEISDEFTRITERYEEMSQNIGRIIDLAEGVEVILSRLSEIEKKLEELGDKVTTVVTPETHEEEDLRDLMEQQKRMQDEEEKDIDAIIE